MKAWTTALSVNGRTSLSAYDLMDAARAFAAITVLVGHERNILFLDAQPGMSVVWKIFYFLTGFGHQAVMVFFVLSGFWITKSIARRSAGNGFAWSEYLIDRGTRLWVVLLPALIIGGILDTIGRYGTGAPLYLGTQGTNTLTFDVAARLTFADFVGTFAFVQTIFVDSFGSNDPLWSLANEFWYYIWFPPLFQLLSKQKPSAAACFFVLVSMIVFRNFLPQFVCWLCGAALFFATQALTSTAARPLPRIAVTATALIFFCVLGLSRVPHRSIDSRIEDVAVSASFALYLFAVFGAAKAYPRWLAPVCRYGAGSSYSLYVVHFPLITLLSAVFVTPTHRLSPSVWLLVVLVAMGSAAILYGYVVSMVTEVHTSEVRGWLKNRYSRVLRISAGNIG